MITRKTLSSIMLGAVLSIAGCSKLPNKEYSSELDGKPVSIKVYCKKYGTGNPIIHYYEIKGDEISVYSHTGEERDLDRNGIPDIKRVDTKIEDRQRSIIFGREDDITFIGYKAESLPNIEEIKSKIETIVKESTKNFPYGECTDCYLWGKQLEIEYESAKKSGALSRYFPDVQQYHKNNHKLN